MPVARVSKGRKRQDKSLLGVGKLEGRTNSFTTNCKKGNSMEKSTTFQEMGKMQSGIADLEIGMLG